MELNAVPSGFVQSGFIGLSVALAVWWVWASGRAYGAGAMAMGRPGSRGFSVKAAAVAAVLVFAWLAVSAVVGHQDWAHTFESFPPPGLRFFLVLLALTILIAYTKPGTMLSQNIPLWLLIAYQAFRIPVEFMIHRAYAEEITIVQMTYLGRNFDIITGITAIVLAVMVLKGKASPGLIKAWNIMGLLLLTNVVLTGILSMPHPMQLVKGDFPNVWITFFPFIWLPGVLVCSAVLGHLLVFRYLSNLKKQQQG
ncbi:MAG: hypothetical protein OEX00_04410 [Gammaproteobacteria bacterium]|nr:hypothetical protein [Gammaproteobacteria bacterium]MDH5694557.1 hypothetical protein [Gammaproteobacteria bacterium]